MLRFIHAADFHLDSAFGALPPQQAASRRRESREQVLRLANYVNSRGIRLVLLAGDLFDSGSVYRETGECLARAFCQMEAQVVIAPGQSRLVRLRHGLADSGLAGQCAHLSGKPNDGAGVSGVEPGDSRSSLHRAGAGRGVAGRIFCSGGWEKFTWACSMENWMQGKDATTPSAKREAAASGLSYLALGHIHKRAEPLRLGGTLCAWPGCIEGRGFDELGEKGFYEGALGEDGSVSLDFVPFARRRYEILKVDVTGKVPQEAVEAALPESTAADLYRILLTGETGERGVDAGALQEMLTDRFYALEIRDYTRMAEDIWKRAEEDSLRGLFLRELRAKLDPSQNKNRSGKPLPKRSDSAWRRWTTGTWAEEET